MGDTAELRAAPDFSEAVNSFRGLIKRRLSHDYVPDSLEPPVGLETQSAFISEQLERALSIGPDAVESFLLLGPRGSGKSYCLDHAIRSINSRHKAAGKQPPLKTIYVNGLLATTDAMAVAEMSRQLQVPIIIGKGRKRKLEPWEHFQSVIEGLRNGYAEKMLYVLILDHMETFASPTRQMLLYTLFDLHHRSDVKFIVIGLTDNFDIHNLLEKRVRSRVSTKCVFFTHQTLDNTLKILNQLLDVPLQGSAIKQRYATAFRQKWQRLMGQPDFLRHLQGPVERGQSTRWYINLAYLMATELTEDQPFFTMDIFLKAMGSLADNRTSTSRTLFGSLSSLELVVIIALKRLVDRKVVPCQAEAIWKEYEAHVRQHPNMTYKYSRDVLHKGLLTVLSLGLVNAYNKNQKACLGRNAAGSDTMSNLELQSMAAKDSMEAVPLTINFHPSDLADFLSTDQEGVPMTLKLWGSSYTND